LADQSTNPQEPLTQIRRLENPKNCKSLQSMFALKDISLDVKRGEFIIIIGKIGSSKSSLLHALLNEMTYVPKSAMDQYGG
jgi:ABC-type polysaccharide/polyol phosphate transport system ATPase subunit